MTDIENLFKNKIQFFRKGLKRLSYSTFNNNSNLKTKYITKLIDNNEDIKTCKDIMDNVEPFFYYLASYYKNDTPWIEYDINFAVSVLKDDNITLITDVVYSIVAEDDHLHIVNREYYGWNIVEAPFKISIYVNANYIQPRMPQIRITHPRPLPHLNK